jgi:hypothetical protein
MCKDMIKKCPAASLAASFHLDEGGDDVLGTVLRDQALDAKPIGTRRCKIACTNVHVGRGNARNSRAFRSDASKNLRSARLGAGPRATIPPQLTSPLVRVVPVRVVPVRVVLARVVLARVVLARAVLARAVLARVSDTDATGSAVVGDRCRCRDSVGSNAVAANAVPLAGNLHCNNALADDAARTAVRIP